MEGRREPKEAFRRAEGRLRAMLFGDGVYEPGFVKGDEPRQHVARELRRLREAFDAALREREEGHVERAETHARALEQELGEVAAELRGLKARAPDDAERRAELRPESTPC